MPTVLPTIGRRGPRPLFFRSPTAYRRHKCPSFCPLPCEVVARIRGVELPSGRARFGGGAGCSALKHPSLYSAATANPVSYDTTSGLGYVKSLG